MSAHRQHHHVDHPHRDEKSFHAHFGSGVLPPGPFAEGYRIAGYADGLVGASPECSILKPKYDSGIKWGGSTPNPETPCWGSGVSGGIRWDGTFYRDLARYSASGALFWSSYFKAGSGPGLKNGYWINFGSGWSHLHNDNPLEILSGAAQILRYDTAAQHWKLTLQATQFVTHEVIDVWTGTKTGGNDPVGLYSRISGVDPLASLSVEAC